MNLPQIKYGKLEMAWNAEKKKQILNCKQQIGKEKKTEKNPVKKDHKPKRQWDNIETVGMFSE